MLLSSPSDFSEWRHTKLNHLAAFEEANGASPAGVSPALDRFRIAGVKSQQSTRMGQTLGSEKWNRVFEHWMESLERVSQHDDDRYPSPKHSPSSFFAIPISN
jgi:hypothetical protein